ncbi:hypothetical protein FB451DRAFT_1174558 [Mycena latifolia]|nr:hypothetical protein FB451DRAFT_1174558 [Mycena latifolia]
MSSRPRPPTNSNHPPRSRAGSTPQNRNRPAPAPAPDGRTPDVVPYRVGQVFGTTMSTRQVAFLAALESAPHHLSFDDLGQYQELTTTDDRAAISRPCVIAEVPASRDLLPKVYVMTTFGGKALTDVSYHMAYWAAKVHCLNVQDAAGEEVIHTNPEWDRPRRGGQYIMAYAIRPTKPLIAWNSQIVVRSADMQNLKRISEAQMLSWGLQFRATDGWSRRRGGPSLLLTRPPDLLNTSRTSVHSGVSPISGSSMPAIEAAVASPREESENVGHRHLPDLYFEMLDDLFKSPWEIAFVNAQLDFHRNHIAVLHAHSSELEPRDRPLVERLLRYHTENMEKLEGKGRAARCAMSTARLYEEEAWTEACCDAAPYSALNLYCRLGGPYTTVLPPRPPHIGDTVPLPILLPAPGHLPLDMDSDAESITGAAQTADSDDDHAPTQEDHTNTSPLLFYRAAPSGVLSETEDSEYSAAHELSRRRHQVREETEVVERVNSKSLPLPHLLRQRRCRVQAKVTPGPAKCDSKATPLRSMTVIPTVA